MRSFKKVGIMFLALVFVLGGIGGAFAAWTDKVDIEGTVNTGNVELNLVDTSSTWVYKTPPHGIKAVTDWGDTHCPEEGWELIGSAVATKTNDKLATVSMDNLFPCKEFKVNFLFHYDGSIPARLMVDDPEFTGLSADFFNDLVWTLPGECPSDSGSYMYGEMWYWESDGVTDPKAVPSGEWTNIADLEGHQVHKCTYVKLVITLYIGQGEDMDPDAAINTTQGLSADFTAGITAIQWNKYEEPNND